MKRVFIVFLLLLLTSPCFALTESFGPEYDKIVTFFQGEDEPEAMDAIWASKSLLKIGVFDNHNDYNAYAKHVCETITNKGIPDDNLSVQIIDIKKLAHLEKWVVLGTAQCQ